MASSSWPSRRAASRGVRPSHTEIQLRGAPRPSKYWAAVRWPPWQAHQKATVNSSGGVSLPAPHGWGPASGDPAKWASTWSMRPSAAACHSAVWAPRSTGRWAARHRPKATASSSGVPPAITGSGCLDAGTDVDEHIEDVDVVAARGPMQRRLGVGPGDAGVDVGTCGCKHGHGGGAVGEMARPIGRDVQEGARAVLPIVAIHGTDPGA